MLSLARIQSWLEDWRNGHSAIWTLSFLNVGM